MVLRTFLQKSPFTKSCINFMTKMVIKCQQPIIHYFANTSQKVYGAIIFLTDIDQVSLILFQERLVLHHGSKYRDTICNVLNRLPQARLTQLVVMYIHPQYPLIFIWSDSQIVLHWVSSTKQPPKLCHGEADKSSKSQLDILPQTCNASYLQMQLVKQLLMSLKSWQHRLANYATLKLA